MVGKPDQAKHGFLYWEFYEQGGKQAVRLGDWKRVRWMVGKDPDGPIKRYQLGQDFGETKKVATDHPDVVKRIDQIMLKSQQPHPQVKFKKPWTAQN